MVPAAKRFGNVKYVVSTNGSFTDQLATVSSPLTLSGWQDVDIAIRLARHLPVPAGDNAVPWVLLTKSNIGTPENFFDRPADYAAQFEKLWHVG